MNDTFLINTVCLGILLGSVTVQAESSIDEQYVAVSGAPYFHPAYEFDDGRAGAWCVDTALYDVQDEIKVVNISRLMDRNVLSDVSLHLEGYPDTDDRSGFTVESFDQYDGRRTFCVPYILRGVNMSDLSAETRFTFQNKGEPALLTSVPGEAG